MAANVVAAGGVLFDGTSRWSRDGAPLHHYLGVSSFAERVVVPASGAVRITLAQRAGKRPMTPADLLRGWALPPRLG